MCGIFGILVSSQSSTTIDSLQRGISSLAQSAESRGKESAGIVFQNFGNETISVLKGPITSTKLIGSAAVKSCFKELEIERSLPKYVMGHARLVTNGTQLDNANNQPVTVQPVVMIHNGIVTNVDALWNELGQHNDIRKTSDVDTEVIAALISQSLLQGADVTTAFQSAFDRIEGAASIAVAFQDRDAVVVATNTGSLYVAFAQELGIFAFASEQHWLTKLAASDAAFEGLCDKVQWLKPKQGIIITPSSLEVRYFSTLRGLDAAATNPCTARLPTSMMVRDRSSELSTPRLPDHSAYVSRHLANEALLEDARLSVATLHRCTRCILPASFPFISFDAKGVCNYCRDYRGVPKPLGLEALEKKFAPFRNKKYGLEGRNCIVALSGGRDSCYGLHLLVKELGMTPLTFTYDWGMVTDLARRNIARMTGALGVEHILVSANIAQKRANIQKNLKAWLRSPDLGIIPLFMAGDKYFCKVVNQIKRQTGLELDIWMTHQLENTDFKTGFCGIPPEKNKARVDSLSLKSKIAMPLYYLKQFIQQPAYLNSSISDTLMAYYAYYCEPRTNFLELFNYIPWNERTIEDTIRTEYNWELAADTKSSWRIGDGTAPFYNYVYLLLAGFTEVDTFKSNQIRAGQLSRTTALEEAFYENAPRYEAIRWYLDTVGLPFNEVIKTVNKAPRLYERVVRPQEKAANE